MAADVGLIKSVSDAYKYQNPNFGKELSQPILEGEDRRRLQKEKLRLEQKVSEERVQKEIKSYLDLYPPGIPLSKIPDKYRPKITEFSFKQKKLYSDAVSARANMQAGTDEYQEQTDIMNNSLQAVNNLKSQWNAFGANKEDNFSNFDDQNFSKANNMDGIALNAAIYTDQFDAEIGDQGDLSFLDGQGNSFNLRDVDQPFLKAADEAFYIETQLVKAFDKGVRLSDASLDLTMSQIRNTIIKGGTDALKSLAVDDLVAGVSLYEPGEDILKRLDSNDPEEAILAREQLQRELLSKYRTSLKSQANQGYLAKNPVEASAEASKNINWLKSNMDTIEKLLPYRWKLDSSKWSDVSVGKGEKPSDDPGNPYAVASLLNQQLLSQGYSVEYDKASSQYILLDLDQKENYRSVRGSSPTGELNEDGEEFVRDSGFTVQELPELLMYVDTHQK